MIRNIFAVSALAITIAAFSGCKERPHRKPLAEPTTEPLTANPAPSPLATPAPVATPTPKPVIDKTAVAIVLCYHRFEDRPKDYLAIKPEEFEKQMQAVKDNGFTVIPMQDFIAWRKGLKSIPKKSAIITIDDGYESGYHIAWPVLKKLGYPFTMFVYIDYIGTGGKSLTWDQLAEMRDAGVDIESHTFSHPNLHGKGRNLTAKDRQEIASEGYDAWLKKQVIGSRDVLEQKLGIKVDAFAYPYGIYNQQVEDLLKQAGFDVAFTVYGKPSTFNDQPYLIGRYAISSREPKIFDMAMHLIGGGFNAAAFADGEANSEAPAITQLAAASMITEPMDGQTINNAKPLIKANIATMGEVDPASVKMRISGVGAVPAKYDAATKTVSYQFTTPLTANSYSVIIGATAKGQKEEAQWSFTFDPKAKPTDPATEPLPPRQPAR